MQSPEKTLAPAPHDVFQTKVLQILLEKGRDNGIAEKAKVFIDSAKHQLDLIISGPFKEFTLHNRDHAKKLIHLVEYISSDEALNSLSSLELLCIVYAAYLHDMGMSLTSNERTRLISSKEFDDTLAYLPQIEQRLKDARTALEKCDTEATRRNLETLIYQLQETVLCHLLRPQHATHKRYEELVQRLTESTGRKDLFMIGNASFLKILVEICVSHNLDASCLLEFKGNEERFPTDIVIGGQSLNAQFIAGILRLVDILDFDSERTPQILFDSIGIADRTLPGAEISLREWQKHRSVHSLKFAANELTIFADCTHPVIERCVRDFCKLIEGEFRDTYTALRRSAKNAEQRYQLDIPTQVRARIISTGYVYKDISLQLNQTAVVNLLMGDKLYSHPGAALRELVQNSIDACLSRKSIDGYNNEAPSISIKSIIQDHELWLEVQDNGLGMDEAVIEKYFLTVGNSYYSSPEFLRLCSQGSPSTNAFRPISRFGIGLLSTFMVGDVIEVTTRRFRSSYSDDKSRFIRVEKLGTLAFIKETDLKDYGTTVRIKMKGRNIEEQTQLANKCYEFLSRSMVSPKVPIHVAIAEKETRFNEPSRFQHDTDKSAEYLSAKDLELHIFDISRWSELISGTVALVFKKMPDGSLSHLDNNRYIRVGPGALDPTKFLIGYQGNRVAVNGFRMTLKRITRLLTGGNGRFAIFYDVDILGVQDLTYDVSREKIVGEGRNFFGVEFWKAIEKALDETGVSERFIDLTRQVFETTQSRSLSNQQEVDASKIPPEVLKGARDLVATEKQVSKDAHKRIANKFGVKNNVAWRALHVAMTEAADGTKANAQ